MDVMGDNSRVCNVDWNHSLLYGCIQYDLSRFGITKDIELCMSTKVRTKVG